MFIQLISPGLLIGTLGALAAYFYFITRTKRRRLAGAPVQGAAGATLQANATISHDPLPALIDRPMDTESNDVLITLEEESIDDPEWQIVPDEDSILLKEAEKVVEEVQTTVSTLSTKAPTEGQLCEALHEILHVYRLFQHTEYYDAINNFVFITVERDCNIKLAPAALAALWN